MILKRIKKSHLILSLLLLSIPSFSYAYSPYIVASGKNIGIKVNSDGILVVGKYDVSGLGKNNILIGDRIVNFKSIDEFTKKINNSDCTSIEVTYIRNNNTYNESIPLVKENNICKSGLYIRDSIIGIGTLTFIDPSTKKFGALGHEIIDKNTNSIFNTKEGTIFNSDVIGISKSRDGSPGEKNAKYYSNEINGYIDENTRQGLFGSYTSGIDTSKLYKVASPKDIKKGEAKILTVINGNEVKEYSIMITKIVENQKVKNIYFDVTSDELLEKTGGIVQGMSGSPIIQEDYIIGAVTHVVVDNPKKGYGIFITNMLEEAEN